ncbi:hypothetical protein Krad_2340 [Kineococcus radiotolerans SRS30216 = ATCC BAA-149]|uniref:Uncharacterized protein n=1 Tax=Kineococcus radiotolerans (strain ATCC BAA-149 / DSM 14245 / SRS30216) TaxID=266940 RepID=A6WAI1_KINRD|nr:hypothetical protein Krad_2340 [Kineococcus radiotolerans SRS30216 = ATCC BAA-149]
MVWGLAAAADFEDCITADHTAALLAREAGVGDRVRNGASMRLSKRCIIAAGDVAAHPRSRQQGASRTVEDSRGSHGAAVDDAGSSGRASAPGHVVTSVSADPPAWLAA